MPTPKLRRNSVVPLLKPITAIARISTLLVFTVLSRTALADEAPLPEEPAVEVAPASAPPEAPVVEAAAAPAPVEAEVPPPEAAADEAEALPVVAATGPAAASGLEVAPVTAPTLVPVMGPATPGQRDVVQKAAGEAGEESIYRRDGLLGPVRLGPTIGVGLPDGLRVGGSFRVRGIVSAGAAMTMVPETMISALDAAISRNGGEAWLRLHPFRGAFFLGAAGGWQTTRGQGSARVDTVAGSRSGEGRGSVSAVYVAPHLGFQWMIPPGITVGFDAGVEIPVSTRRASVELSHNGGPVDVEAQGPVDALNFIGTRPIPVLHILDIGVQL